MGAFRWNIAIVFIMKIKYISERHFQYFISVRNWTWTQCKCDCVRKKMPFILLSTNKSVSTITWMLFWLSTTHTHTNTQWMSEKERKSIDKFNIDQHDKWNNAKKSVCVYIYSWERNSFNLVVIWLSEHSQWHNETVAAFLSVTPSPAFLLILLEGNIFGFCFFFSIDFNFRFYLL